MKVIEVEITKKVTFYCRFVTASPTMTDDMILREFYASIQQPIAPPEITINRLGEYDCLKK